MGGRGAYRCGAVQESHLLPEHPTLRLSGPPREARRHPPSQVEWSNASTHRHSGRGLYRMEGLALDRAQEVETPFGEPWAPCIWARWMAPPWPSWRAMARATASRPAR